MLPYFDNRKSVFSLYYLVFVVFGNSVAALQPVSPTEHEPVGLRPYEMVNAERTEDNHPPLIDFENLEGWTVETYGTNANFCQSRRQQLWGDYVGHLSFTSEFAYEQSPWVVLSPPEPVPIPTPFDCASIWVHGDTWGKQADAQIARVMPALLLQGSDGKEIRIPTTRVVWKEWFLLHRRLAPSVLEALGNNPCFVGIEVDNTRQDLRERHLFFDNISFYQETLKPLTFEKRPRRPLRYPEGQGMGMNIGEGFLPFPTREETILPTSRATNGSASIRQSNNDFEFVFQADEERPTIWRYRPKTGTLADLSGEIAGRKFETNVGARVLWTSDSKIVPSKAELISVSQETAGRDSVVRAVWKHTFGIPEQSCTVTLLFRLWNRSLVVDLHAPGGLMSEWTLGVPIPNDPDSMKRDAFIVPYLTGDRADRPAVRMFHDGQRGGTVFFHLGLFDHTRSNGSELFFDRFEEGGNGVRYKPKTDGQRNDCFERIFMTMAPTFEEVLPNIPNPVSSWRNTTAGYLKRAFGARNREQDYAFWKNIHRYGMRQVNIHDHEEQWRDGGESFTFRTSTAPGKGGDASQLEYTRKIHALGFPYGPYNAYTDISPVNAYWNEDWITRVLDGNWQPAWARCYNVKPQIAVEMEPRIAASIQKKFGFNTAYCDVHSSIPPWRYVDYDARVPGAGTLAATFYAYGEIMLHQKKIWGGPVYGEGTDHWFYSGLTDGNFAMDRFYFIQHPDAPWLVDFDLWKIHPQENNFGMGNIPMLLGQDVFRQNAKGVSDAMDKFIAATLAFGHTGFFETQVGLHFAARTYFLMQAIGQRMGTQNVKSIRYADADGHLLTTEQALVDGSISLRRIRVEYEDGFTIHVNGNDALPWTLESGDILPSYGFIVDDPTGEVVAGAVEREGTRFDYAEGPSTIYADGRGRAFGYRNLYCDGPIIVMKNDDGSWEVIPIREGQNPCGTFAVRMIDTNGGIVHNADAIALDREGKEIGIAENSYSPLREMLSISPKSGATSYLIKPAP